MADDHPTNGSPPPGVSRRSFIQTLGVSAAAGAVTGSAEAAPIADGDGIEMLGPGPVDVTLSVNGGPRTTRIEPTTTLLDALRIRLDLTGSKEVCDRGACGGCSVLVDGRLVASCMMLAVDAVGSDVQTIEGLADGTRLHVLQESFIRHDALQCGFCTPGLLMASKALLDEHPRPSLDQIRKGLSGNICRCGTYTNIFNAVLEASGQSPIQDGGAS